MSSLQTFFRTVVMLATLGIVAKLWFLYGPNVGEMKSIGARVVELSEQAWNEYWKSTSNTPSSAADSQLAMQPAPFVPPSGPMQPIPLPPVNSTAPSGVKLANNTGAVPTAPPLSPAILPSPAANAKLEPMGPTGHNDRLVTDVQQLLDLGVDQPQVRPWGNGGLYRCVCEAPWKASPNYSRHFESVANTAEAAVEQVTAQVAAWQNSQRGKSAGQ
ncbi:MAG TPA: hypothetical protein VGM76_06905 [Lacipirellulaceae bacterium]